MNAAPCILAAACTFPSGTDIRLADAAVRTQLALLGRHPVYRDAAGAAPRISSFPDEQRYDAARWALLARHALAQLTQALLPQWDALQAAPRLLWLVVPDAERPGMPDGVAARIGEAMQHPLWPWQRITIVAGGHAAGIDALLAARQALTEAPGAMAVVLAAESGLAADALLWLDLQGLLHGAGAPGKAGTRGNPYGRVPGEGAAAVALAAAPPASGPGWARL
ncbi:MAG: beta-ketoacyl synthase, partial [Burkholderiales bacterium]|nr:beta-ketoacyl synthase [Burkholderiales bacterium]